ncbi:MAG: DNA polymerase III subunit gamma/tau [Acidobacteria bacterium]|nr:MAG: DNA polymerase III subunit gamma/tau [Acidobacteriota bacterium]
MQYQVLARKWRPQNFRELVGQEHVSRTLVNALRAGRVAHALLFAGPRGSGKTTTARVLAKALNCHRNLPGEPCGECVACREIAAGNCMDVLEMDAASNRGIDEIRDLIENVRYNPARDRHKIFIIDEVHMLTEPAFNALLKTLEEPPPHVVFIMATTEYHKIPATILSRCQQYNFKLIPLPLVLGRLKEIAGAEGIEIGGGALEAIAYSSGGSLRDAMSAFDAVIAFSGSSVRDEDVTMLLGLVEPSVLGDTVRAIARSDTDAVFEIVGKLVEAGQDLQNFCRRLLGQFRNLMVLRAGVRDPALLGVPESLLPDLRAQAELFEAEDLLRLFDALIETEADLKRASHPRFPLEMGLVKLAQIARLRPLEDLIAEFRQLSPGESSGGPQAARPESGTRPADEKLPVRNILIPDEEPSGGAKLVERIAAAVSKQSLAPILGSVSGATISGDTLTLDVSGLNEFIRGQIRDNLGVVADAASAVLGRTLRVALAGEPAAGLRNPPAPAARADEVLDRVKKEPVVQSFLDVFPGPVKAEGID